MIFHVCILASKGVFTMNDIVKPVAQWAGENIGWTALIILFVFSLFFEFSKIKLSPITAVLNWIGGRLTGTLRAEIAQMKTDTAQKIDELKKETDQRIRDLDNRTSASLAEIKEGATSNCKETQKKLLQIELAQDVQSAARINAQVLNFSRSLRVGEKHTEEDFKNLIKENEEYERLTQKNKWTNDVYKADYEFFYHEFQRCQRENDFLKWGDQNAKQENRPKAAVQ